MKHLLTMKSPSEFIIGIAGIIAGGFTYLRTNLELLQASYYINWEKVVGLLWGMLVALLTGMFAVFGKRLADIALKRYFAWAKKYFKKP